MKLFRKFYDIMGDGTIGAYKDVDGDWIEYNKPPQQKQESVEQAAENHSKRASGAATRITIEEDFVAGAKWKEQQMYSEDDIEDILLKAQKASFIQREDEVFINRNFIELYLKQNKKGGK